MSRRASLLGVLLLALGARAALPAEIPVITHGDQVRLEDHLVPGKYVLFDFYADWCGPCRMLEPHVRALAEQNPDRLAVRKVDIVGWDSAVSRQFRIRFVPFLKLYGPDGALVQEGDAATVLGAATSALGGGPVAPGGGAGRGGFSFLIPLVVALAVIGAAVYLLVGRRSKLPPTPASAVSQRPAQGDQPEPARVWFVKLQGALEGPFALPDLESMVRRGQLARDTEIRRRGDAEWRRLGDVVEG